MPINLHGCITQFHQTLIPSTRLAGSIVSELVNKAEKPRLALQPKGWLRCQDNLAAGEVKEAGNPVPPLPDNSAEISHLFAGLPPPACGVASLGRGCRAR